MSQTKSTGVIRIESILGGQSASTQFAAADQFRVSLGIDPGLPINDIVDNLSSNTKLGVIPSGILRPTPTAAATGTALNNTPLWIKKVGKATFNIFIYDAQGSAYTLNPVSGAVTGLSDGGSLTNSKGNGMEYYDNYVYFAKNTTIARYGPLDGSSTAVFDGDYWVTTLAKAALTNPVTVPDAAYTSSLLPAPNHCMKRHSDGKLYFVDVQDNKAVVHMISTTKTTWEGDTNNGSAAQVLTLGYGLKPMAIESYGADLVIAFAEWELASFTSWGSSKLAFWDTTSANFNKIIWVEYPDHYISALKNINGTLYVTSGNFTGVVGGSGFRVTRFIGGYSFEEIAYMTTGMPPFPGALDGSSNRLLFASYTTNPEICACVYSLGLQSAKLSNGLFNVIRCTGAQGSGSSRSICAYAVCLTRNYDQGFHFDTAIVGWASDTPAFGLDLTGYTRGYGNSASVWWSQTYKIGVPFRITRIRIPFGQTIPSGAVITPKLYFDNGRQVQTLTVINSTNFPSTTPGDGIVANIRPNASNINDSIMGQQNFWLELRWTGTSLLTVDLPITIEFETVPD